MMPKTWKQHCTKFNLSLKRVTPENMIRNSSPRQMRKTMQMPRTSRSAARYSGEVLGRVWLTPW